MKFPLTILIILLTIDCLGQCAVATMESEEGYRFNQSMREGIDPNKVRESNDLISLLRVDSTKLKTETYFVTVLLKDHQDRKGQSTLKLTLKSGDNLLLHEQRIELSIVDYGFGFDENEIFYPINKHSYDKISRTELLRIEVHGENKILDVVPDKTLLKRLAKCLQ